MNIHCEHVSTILQQTELIKDMISLATQVSSISEEYILARFPVYDHVIYITDQQGLCAFQFINQFEHEGEYFVYFGPLFSVRNGYLPLFLQFYKQLLSTNKKRSLHLMAEIQNPELLLTFKVLFWHTSYPLVQRKQIPPRIQQIASVFSKQLDHIHNLQVELLRSESTTSLYQGKGKYDSIIQWLHTRDIHIETGDNQVLIVTHPPFLLQRLRVRLDLLIGLYRLKHWKKYKPRMLAKFAR